MEKTKDDLQRELDLIKILKEERDISNKSYAIKWVERIVFALVGLLLTGIVGALLRVIIIK